MFISRLKPGEKVYLHKVGATGKGIMSRVEDYHPYKNEVQILEPQVNGRPVSLNDENEYELRMFAEVAEYRFKVQFVSHGKIDGFPVSKFALLDNGEKKIKRNSFRLNLNSKVKFSVVHDDGNQSDKVEGEIVDLSVGGAKIHTHTKPQKGELLNLNIQVDSYEMIAFGEVKFAAPTSHTELRQKNKPKYPYQCGISFVTLCETDQEKIIKYLHKKRYEKMNPTASYRR